MQRRIVSGGILAGLAAPRPAKAKAGGIPTRVLGKTEVERIFAPGGAMEAFQAAKKAGTCRYIGYTAATRRYTSPCCATRSCSIPH